MNINFLRSFDNAHLDLGRVLWAIGAVVYLGVTFFVAHKGQAIDWVAWATGFAIVHAAGAAGAGGKDIAVAKAAQIKQALASTVGGAG